MTKSLHVRSLLAAGTSMVALLGITGSALAADQPAPPTVGEIVVTAQKKEEALQDVPIAVSAFTQDALEKAKIDGGGNLVLAVPNVNFSRANFGGSNFAIRGIGTKLVATSADSGTGVHLNNAPLGVNLTDAEFFDVERIEVLRGPQGTLYGRNATGGVVNLITAKPVDSFEASLRGEVGNFNSRKVRGMINVPFGDTVAVRLAGSYLKRDGFGDNLVTGNDIDDRDHYGARLTVAIKPTDTFRVNLMWDRFKEDDTRSRIGRQLCSKDLGPATVGGSAFSSGVLGQAERGFFTQGCRATSLGASDIQGTINSVASLGGQFGLFTGAQTGDAFAGKFNPSDIRDIEAYNDPEYNSKTDVFLVDVAWDLTDELTLTSISGYARSSAFNRQDYNRVLASVPFNVVPNPTSFYEAIPGYSTAIYPLIFPNGTYADPQVGTRDRYQAEDISSGDSKTFTQELRLQSNFDYPLNFSIGGIFVDFKTTTDYYVMFNTGTSNYDLGNLLGGEKPCAVTSSTCVYIDTGRNPDRSGHNYFDSYNVYHLQSRALFGELYYQMTDNFKWTMGLRYTDDNKTAENHQVSLGVDGSGILGPAAGIAPESNVRFRETTGRFGFDYKPTLSFTDESLFYGFISRGYKAGGLNPPCSASIGCLKGTFEPEFIRSIEFGTKNTLLNGTLQFNAGVFTYDYTGYQVSKIVNRTSNNENLDAEVKGLEIETIWAPITGLRLNANIGYLDTEITGGTSIDTFDRTNGDPSLIVVKALGAANCVVPVTTAQTYLALAQSTGAPLGVLGGMCTDATATDGVAVNLSGKELPNAPKWTVSLGAQYTFGIGADWEATIRTDYYRQTETFARIYNTIPDQLPEWDNINMTITVANPSMGWSAEVFVKNLTDEEVITDTYLTDDSSGLFRNAFYTDPRTYGVSLTKTW